MNEHKPHQTASQKSLEQILFEKVQGFASEEKKTVMREEMVKVVDYGPGGIENMWMGSITEELQEVPEIMTYIAIHPTPLRTIFAEVGASPEDAAIAVYNVFQRVKNYGSQASDHQKAYAALFMKEMSRYAYEQLREDWLRNAGNLARSRNIAPLSKPAGGST